MTYKKNVMWKQVGHYYKIGTMISILECRIIIGIGLISIEFRENICNVH